MKGIMMNKSIGSASLALLLLGSGVSPARADCFTWGCGPELTRMLYLNDAGDVYIQPSGNVATVNCAAVSGVYLTVKSTNPNFKTIYAMLLAAQLAGKRVNLRVNEN